MTLTGLRSKPSPSVPQTNPSTTPDQLSAPTTLRCHDNLQVAIVIPSQQSPLARGWWSGPSSLWQADSLGRSIRQLSWPTVVITGWLATNAEGQTCRAAEQKSPISRPRRCRSRPSATCMLTLFLSGFFTLNPSRGPIWYLGSRKS